uniref:Uncharacterized protein n=1 Tax=Anopheles maculatus TaxID=74869 RepID=A0A182SCB0_9DIPT
MFELSDYLVGIYKVSDCTNSVTIENDPQHTGSPMGGAASQQQPTQSQQFGFGHQSVNLQEEEPYKATLDASSEDKNEAVESSPPPADKDNTVNEPRVVEPQLMETSAEVESSTVEPAEAQPMEVEEEQQKAAEETEGDEEESG